MLLDPLKYFTYAKELNDEHHKVLRKEKLHFRGNINSFSLISLDPKTPELGSPPPEVKNKSRKSSLRYKNKA